MRCVLDGGPFFEVALGVTARSSSEACRTLNYKVKPLSLSVSSSPLRFLSLTGKTDFVDHVVNELSFPRHTHTTTLRVIRRLCVVSWVVCVEES